MLEGVWTHLELVVRVVIDVVLDMGGNVGEGAVIDIEDIDAIDLVVDVAVNADVDADDIAALVMGGVVPFTRL